MCLSTIKSNGLENLKILNYLPNHSKWTLFTQSKDYQALTCPSKNIPNTIHEMVIKCKGVITLTLGLQPNVECKGSWGEENVFKCETHFHKWRRMQGWSPMTPKCIVTLKVALVQKSQMFKALIGKAKKHKIRPSWYHWKFLEV
jgi:hypothetical protein